MRATKWDGTISLRPGLAFARVVGVPATLTIHEPPSAHVTVDASIRLHALVERPVIHAARPTTLSEFAIPFPDTGLDWARVDRAGKITVEIATADLFADPPKATLEVDCGDLTATEPTYDLPGVLRGLPGVEVSLAGGAAIAATPLGAIVATLGSEGAPAVVIESKGASRRVVVRAYGYWAVGWVDAKFVGNDAFVRGESGRGFLDGYGEYAGTPPSCDHELPVFGQIANERAHLGTLRAGTGYRRTAPQPDGLEPGWTSIALVSPWLRPLEGAWLLVRNEDLTNCP